MTGFTSWVLVFARIGALLAVLPLFSMPNVPVRLRVALSGLVALLIVPFIPTIEMDGLSTWPLVRLIFLEISVGLLLGFASKLVFFALDAAGHMIATEMGLTMSSEFNPMSGTQSSAPGLILYWMAVMIWFSLDLHHWMIAALQRSYTFVPIGGMHLSGALLQEMIRKSASVFVMAVQLAAPMIGVSFGLSLVLALLGRAVPQMNVFAESFSIRTLVGLVIFGSTCLFLAQQVLDFLRRLPEDVLRIAQLLGNG